MRKEAQQSVHLLPEYQQLKEDIENLRMEISSAILKRDGLQLLESREIQMKHLLKLGIAEYRVQMARYTMLRLRRKAELIAEMQNQEKFLSQKDIEALLDKEFEEDQKMLKDKRTAIHQAFTRNRKKWILKQNMAVLDERYHKIIKALHPDLHLNGEMLKLELYHQATVAYEHEDLVTICLIAEMVSTLIEGGSESAWSMLRSEKSRLEQLLLQVRREIAEIEQSYPFTVKELVRDDNKIEKRKLRLQQITVRYEENIRQYQEQIRNLDGSWSYF